MSKFKYRGPVEVLHVNARKEGDEEDRALAVDVKVRATTDRAVLDYFDPFVEGDTGPRLAAALFLDSGAVRNTLMGPITFENRLEHYALDIFDERMVGCRVKKFSLLPADVNQIVLTFQISFAPTGDVMAKIAEFLQEDIEIELRPEDGELFDAADKVPA